MSCDLVSQKLSNDVLELSDDCTSEQMNSAEMLEKHYDPNHIMWRAAYEGNLDGVKLMLEEGATDVEWAMKFAAEAGHIHIVKFLSELELDRRGACYDTALLVAASKGHTDIVLFLLDKGAKNEFAYATCYAAREGHTDIVKLLLEVNSDRYIYDILRFAVYGGNIYIVRLVLEKRADIHKTKINDTDAQEEEAWLKNYEADKYQDAIRTATKREYNDIVKLLLEHEIL